MTHNTLKSLLFAAVTALAVGCGPGPAGTSIQLIAPDAGPPAAGNTGNTGRTFLCTSEDLCERSLNECNVNLTQTACESWYSKPLNCRDMMEYVACNCECLPQATCSDYFACGKTCFTTYCK